MSGHLYYKNNFYCITKRTYTEDYGYIKSRKIDMTLSGTYLYKYPFKIIKKYRLDKYPNSMENEILIKNIRKKYNCYNDDYTILLGPGSNGLIQNICKVLLREGDNLITPYLTFGQAEYAASSFGAETRRVFLDNFNINLELFKEAIDANTKLIYICNPNNPTGLLISNKDIIEFAKKYPKVYIMIDESNIEFSNMNSLLNEELLPNLIVLKSFSKAYGLSNLRIGYLVFNKELYESYKKSVTVNEFSGLSTYYANKAICSNNYVKNVEMIKKELEFLKRNLDKIGIETFDTNSNTLFTKTVFKREFMEVLEEHDISLVPIIDQNDKLHFRIACQKHITNKMFIKELLKIKDIKEYIWKN